MSLNKYSDAQLSFPDGVGAERKKRRKRKEEQRERGDIMSDVCYDVSAVKENRYYFLPSNTSRAKKCSGFSKTSIKKEFR